MKQLYCWEGTPNIEKFNKVGDCYLANGAAAPNKPFIQLPNHRLQLIFRDPFYQFMFPGFTQKKINPCKNSFAHPGP